MLQRYLSPCIWTTPIKYLGPLIDPITQYPEYAGDNKGKLLYQKKTYSEQYLDKPESRHAVL